MPNIARDSHYVPQATLRRWSEDGQHVQAYRILVSHSEVPEWTLRSIRGLAYQRDLYTTFAGGQELDEFERWIAKEYEEPGFDAVNKLVARHRLTPSDWISLARFVAAQDVRTPLNFIESMQRWDQQIPAILENTIRESVRKLQEAKNQGVRLEPPKDPNAFSELFRVQIEPPVDPNSEEALIRADVSAGRRLWIATMRHLLTGAAQVLCQHRWSVVEPHHNEEWPLTDHPVIRLNYYQPGQYDFRGGWGYPGSEIMMPLSPRHLLYVQVGKKAPNRLAFSREQTQLVQRLIVERAHRWIFARQPIQGVAEIRPRVIDATIVKAEEEAWKSWPEEQLRSEVPYHKKLDNKDA